MTATSQGQELLTVQEMQVTSPQWEGISLPKSPLVSELETGGLQGD